MTFQNITAQDFHNNATNSILIDVRSPGEFASQHAVGAINLPLDRIDSAQVEEYAKDGQDIVIICASGTRAKMACEKLEADNTFSLKLIEGGTSAWVAAGLPTINGKGSISIERQVRIGAGTMVAVGTILGAFVNPYWLILPGFVGCGLTFAGITDFCGMGLLLAKMPWNNKPAGCATP